jgi:hypothetical protein
MMRRGAAFGLNSRRRWVNIARMKILIVRPGALGDTIMAEPLVRALGAWKNIGLPGAVILAGTMPQARLIGADKAVDIDALNVGGLFTPGGEIPQAVDEALGGCDLAVSFWGKDWDVFAENLKRTGCRKSLGRPAFPEGGSGVHAVDHLLDVTRELKVPPASNTPRIEPAKEWLAAAQARMASLGTEPGKYLVIHTGAGSADRCWDPSGFAWVAKKAEKELGLRPVLIRGPADAGAASSFLDVYGGPVGFVNGPPLPELAGLLARSGAYVGNDSGVTHLAAAVGAKTVAVFFASDPAVWGPRGENVAFADPTGLSRSAGDVYAALCRLLGRGAPAPKAAKGKR